MTGDAVITGIGLATPSGLGAGAHWAATLARAGAIRRITRFDPSPYPSTLAGQVDDPEVLDHVPNRLVPQTDHVTRLSLAAGDEALADARIDPAVTPARDMGVVTANSAGGFEFGQRELQSLWGGDGHVSAYQSFAWFYAVNTGQLSIRYGMRGPSGVLVSEQAGGLDAIGQARREVRRGTPIVLTGGMEGALCPWGWVAQLATGRVSERSDPATAYVPFTRDADGYVPGEGGALLVVEDGDAARTRGARVYGTVAGYAATFDPRPGSARPGGLLRAVHLALADAGRDDVDVDVVFADAAGVPELDRAEASVLATVFAPRGVPVTAPKTMTGRLYAGGAAVDVADALLCIRTGIVPPTANLDGATVHDELDLVAWPRPARVRTALVVARGHNGFNSAILLTDEGTTT